MRFSITAIVAILGALVAPLMAAVPGPVGQMFISTIHEHAHDVLPSAYVFSRSAVEDARPCQPMLPRLPRKPREYEVGVFATLTPESLTFNTMGIQVYDFNLHNGIYHITNDAGILVGTCTTMTARYWAECSSPERSYVARADWSCLLNFRIDF